MSRCCHCGNTKGPESPARAELKEKLEHCSEKQRELFTPRIYKSLEDIPDDKLASAIALVDRTLVANGALV